MGTLRLAIDFEYYNEKQQKEIFKLYSELIQYARLDLRDKEIVLTTTVGNKESFISNNS